ncbi:DUF349 domain-containing protein [Marinobacter bryozoorum]|uniref:DUF349 domain-containing protein n=1 Tax=Marinobacter bryozoorum TaxID=256324 RepID=UPI002003667B|nr:DUF349 domain-containing protein [Marinobacter bryozoorum]MCK7545154.1 DUF349 domain-containing protein [Marinobacter bryozoorum]
MAAFIQRLFQKRFSAATSQENRKKARQGSTPEKTTTPGSETSNESQEAIDAQRALLAQQNCSQQALAGLAIDGQAADIRLGAAQRLTDQDQLQQVQKRARGKDKGVYQQVRNTLKQLRRDEEQAQATSDALAAVQRQASELASTRDTNLYEARLQKLEQQWHLLEPQADNDIRTQVLSALHECRQRARELEQQHQAEKQQEAQRAQREETLELLRETAEDLASEPPAHSALPALDALQRTQENRWLEATRDTEVSRQEQKLYEQAMLTLRAAITALRRLAQHQDEVDQVLNADTPVPEAARRLLEQLDWPRGIARPDTIQGLGKASRIRTPQQPMKESPELQRQKTVQFEQALTRLEEALEARQLKESRQFLKQAQALQRELGGRDGSRYRARMQRLAGQVRELGDWRGFATAPKQTALCEQMEYLADQPMEPEAKATRIQELQQEWRELGGSSDRELWQRFRAASDKAFEPCRAYFEARSDLKKIHLQKRQTICDELERYLEATDWTQSVDWKAAEQIEKTARKEWREAWPVEFRDNRAVQKTFDRLMNTLAGHLDEERTRNEARKQAVVDRARELIEHSPLAEAMTQAKDLQKQWQSIGITRHREDRKLWKAFRAACDEIFSRRDEQRQQQVRASDEADRLASAELAKARAWLDDQQPDPDAAEPLLSALKASAASPVSDNLQQTLRKTRRELEERRQQLRHQANIRDWQRWIEQRRSGDLEVDQLPAHWQALSAQADLDDPQELVVLAEILGGHPSPESDQSLRMALQVRRLKQGLEGDQGNSPLSPEALVARWCLELPAGDLTDDLAKRLQRALELA